MDRSWMVVVCLVVGIGLVEPAWGWEDSFEGGLGGWTTNGMWGLTTATSVSPSHSVADSPGGYYTNDTDATLTLNSGINLAVYARPALRYDIRHFLEENYDYLAVEGSTNAGASWFLLEALTGTQDAWQRRQVSLTSRAGSNPLLLRFRITTDDSVTMDGVYLDDLLVGSAPAAVTVFTNATTATRVDLSWAAPAPSDFTHARVWRSVSSNVVPAQSVLVREVTDAGTTSLTDVAVSPKSTYWYAVAVEGTNGLETLSSPVQARTAVGMEFPFLDNGEGGGGTWVADAPWALSIEAAANGSWGWSDSPGTNYQDNANVSLTLAAAGNLSGWSRPVLMFQHRYHFLAGDFGYVEVSTNSGSSWTALASFTAASSSWTRARYDLSAYAGGPSLLLRYRLTSDASGTADGWMLDDISISDAPDTVPAPAASQIQPTSLCLDWDASTHPALSHYIVARSLSNNPSINTEPSFTVTSNTYTDTGLMVYSSYYYRVYAVNAWGGYSPDSPTASVARTIYPVLPFSEGFESGAALWTLQAGWRVSTGAAYAGTAFLENGVDAYSNSIDSSAITTLNLTGAVRPVLRFADWHRLAVNDYGYLEVSAPGRSGLRLYGVYGARTNWAEQVVDLSYYKGCANVQILFRLTTDGSGTDTGWKIDDVRVADEGSAALPLPFVEDFEAGLGPWVETSRWQTVTGGYLGVSAAADNFERITPETRSYGSLDGDFDLTPLTSPQLSAWVKGSLGNYSAFNLEVSADGGANWATLWSRSTESGNFSNAWQRVQVSLAPYKASNARVRWVVHSYYGTLADANVFLDKLTVADAPPGVGVLPAVPGLKSAEIHWTPSGLGAAFQAYRILRSPDTNPENGNDTFVGAVSNAATTSYTDTGLAIGATYYYWVYVADTNDIWTVSTNYVATTTVPVVLPFADAFADAGQWDTTGTWGVDTNENVLTDSPDGDYANGLDTYAQTAVNLVGTAWPVLQFQDACRFAANDYGYVEVSPNGSSYTRVYGVGGAQTNGWAAHEIDLSQWKNQSNLRIRFHLTTDGGGTDNGWQIDDVSVTDRGAQTLPVPFYDGFERGQTNWLEDTWSVATNQPYAGSNLLATAVTQIRPEVQTRLPLGGAMDLSLTTNPKVTFRVRGYLLAYSALDFQISPDGGINWANLWSVSTESGWGTNVWTTQTFALASYRYTEVRFRFLLRSYYGTLAGVNVALDHFSVGESTPGAPAPYSPAPFANVESIRPTLIVDNAFDPDFDPLTYRFEVYGDESLTNGLLAQVPAVASGTERTAWQVDVNLANSRQYWWRCRATDGSNTGPWMATATFYINETNTPPATVQIAGPPKGANLRTGAGILSWYPSTDSDAGDEIITYQIQVADSTGFSHVLVDAQVAAPIPAPTGTYVTISQPLNTLTGWEALGMVSNYNWRIRALDSRFAWSAWSSGVDWFIYGVPPPDLTRIVRSTNGQMSLSWTVGSENVRVWFSPALNPPAWEAVAGPINDSSSYTLQPPTNISAGFYRVTGQ